MDILSMKNMRAFRARTPASEEQILIAERDLNLTFSDEYKLYLLAFGCASVFGHEFTGITSADRLDVVKVTNEEKVFCPSIHHDMYVVEQTHCDDIVIWQTDDGCIYQTRCNSEPKKIADSLYEYLNMGV